MGTQNAFGLGTLGLRAGVAKRFDAHHIELLYRYGMAFGSKRRRRCVSSRRGGRRSKPLRILLK
jgi:hypothetical protein